MSGWHVISKVRVATYGKVIEKYFPGSSVKVGRPIRKAGRAGLKLGSSRSETKETTLVEAEVGVEVGLILDALLIGKSRP